MRTFSAASWLMLILAMAAWIGVGFFWVSIDTKMAIRTQRLEALSHAAQEQLVAAHVKALLKETADGREKLDAVTSTDILSAVETVESSGKPLGLNVHISSATPIPSPRGSLLHAVSFELSAEGSYASLMRLIEMLESLPLITTIERVELHAVGDPSRLDQKSQWHFDARIKLFTTANVSS